MLSANKLNVGKFLTPKIFVSLKNEILYGGYFIALIGPALVISTCLLSNTTLSISLLIISYLIPLMVYSFDYYKDMDKDKGGNQERSAHFTGKKKIYPYIMGSYLLILSILLLLSNWMMIAYFLALIIVGIFYSFGLKRFTQKMPAFKNIYTVIIWSLAGSFSVVFYNAQQIELVYILISLLIFLKMLPNAIFFDLKDIISDRKEGLKTIPVLLGKEKTIKLLYKLNIVALIPLLLGIYLNVFPVFSSIMLLFFIYSGYYLYKTSKTKDGEEMKMYYFLADAEFMIWPVVLFVGKVTFGI